MPYDHLRLGREEPLTDRHRRQDRRPRFKPDDPCGFGSNLRDRFRDASERNAQADIGGFDSRRLLKIQLRAGEKLLPQFDAIPGIEIVSQEAETIVLAFATDEGLANFERRLSTLAQTGDVTRKELLYVVEDFDRWTRDDRLGTALREQGLPDQPAFMLDVELWPVEAREQRDRLLVSFRQWLQKASVELLDTLSQPSLVMVRVRCTAEAAEALLQHRDVRTVDLPPKLGIRVEILSTDINRFPDVPPPATNAPAVVVLDAGLTPGHALIGAAVGDAQGFVEPLRGANDQVPNGHGTFVAGIALYGDVEARIRAGEFVPSLRLHSGKVFEDDGYDQTEFVERAVDEATRYFHTEYGCRVFNFSYGDRNKVYDGRHLRGLAYTLDRLTRELGVLYVVPTGNLVATELPANPREAYPEYLLAPHARLLDPAPALNVLTVGGLTVKTATREAQRHAHGIEDHPLAQTGQPAPFTRAGLSIGNAIKPDVVEEAGNWAIPRAGGAPRHRGLGIVSLNSGSAAGSPFAEDVGTSYGAPMVAYKAAMLTGKLPDASANLLRAVLVAHARWPQASVQLLDPASNAEGQKRLLRLAGYGQIIERAMYESLDDVVTLLAEDSIGNDQHHFYELPVADEFWRGQRRTRAISVALAYSPEVRTTRLDYRRSKLSFSLVAANSLDDVTRAFTRGRQQGLAERSTNRLITNNERKAGTLQMSRWQFRSPLGNGEKLFVVVTRQDSPWPLPQEEGEPYALAVVLDDSANVLIDLYALTQAQLEVRAQARARARVRG
jgi:hypothetical protein